VLTPTRELAVQIDESFAAYGRYTSVTGQVIYGGVSQHTQTLALRNGTDVLVATPGRLLDLMNQGYVHLDHLELFVLDEADRMLDMGFINDVKKIIRALAAGASNLVFLRYHACAHRAACRQPAVLSGESGSDPGFVYRRADRAIGISCSQTQQASACWCTCCKLPASNVPCCLPVPSTALTAW
jgi:hypothetical protein